MRINKKILQDLAKFIEMRYGVDVTKHNKDTPELFKTFMRIYTLHTKQQLLWNGLS